MLVVAKVIVFIDGQNVYNDARRAFFPGAEPMTRGQFNPRRLGELLCSRQPLGTNDDRELKEVRIYRGRPNSTKEPKTYGAHMRQSEAWEKLGVTVIHRPLRYPGNWPTTPAEEKGIDVQIAIDMVRLASIGELDIAVLCSTDTDLRPAVEAFFEMEFDGEPRVEVASWSAGTFKKAIKIPDRHVWCHYLNEDDYMSVKDWRDYNIKK